MSDNPLSSKVVFDTTDFKAGVTELNRQIRVVESGFKAAAAGMGDWEKNSAGLEARIKSLTSSMDLQRQKVDGLQGVYDQLAAAGKTSAKELQELQIKINKETETLNKMQGELDKSTTALDEMGKESQDTGSKVDNLADQEKRAEENAARLDTVMRGLGGALKIGAAAIAGLATAAAGAVVAITGLVLKSAEMAGELVDTANVTGIGVERLQELAFIGGQVGVSTETMTGSLAKMTRAMSSARDGTGDQAKAFKTLGVAIKNSDGSLRDSEEVWQDSLKALGGVANETERDALAMELFGKSAMELNPLIKTSAEELDALTEKAHELGAVMSEEDVNSLESFGDTLAGLKAGLQGTLGTLATAFLPGFKGIAGMAEKYLGQFSKIVSGADGDLGKMADGIGGLLGQIASDIAVQGPKMLQAGLGIIQGIVNAIVTNLPTLLPAAVSMITTLVQFIVNNLPILINAGVQVVTALVNGILPMLPMLIQAALTMLITLATGIAQALPTLIPAVVAIIPKIIEIIVQNLPLLITAAIQILAALVTGIAQALPILIEAVPQIIQALIDGFVANGPMIYAAAIELNNAMALGLVQNLQILLGAALEMIDGIKAFFIENAPQWLQIGKDIIEGIRLGWDAAWSGFIEYISGSVADMVDWVKKVLGIASPSQVFAGIGENMALGLGVGFDGAFAQIQREVSGAIASMGNAGLGINVSPTFAGGTAANGGVAPITVYLTVEGPISSEIDWQWAARKVAEEFRRAA